MLGLKACTIHQAWLELSFNVRLPENLFPLLLPFIYFCLFYVCMLLFDLLFVNLLKFGCPEKLQRWGYLGLSLSAWGYIRDISHSVSGPGRESQADLVCS